MRIALDGERVDNYRGRQSTQATASGTASGPGDVIVRAKYNALRRTASGVALGLEARLPTGDEDNLLGTGQATVIPRAIASLEGVRAGVHGNVGYAFGGFSEALDYSGAITFAASPRLTLVGEMAGRRLASIGRLTETVAPHPSLVGVDTVRLTTTNEPTARLVAAAGVKWNFRLDLASQRERVSTIDGGGLDHEVDPDHYGRPFIRPVTCLPHEQPGTSTLRRSVAVALQGRTRRLRCREPAECARPRTNPNSTMRSTALKRRILNRGYRENYHREYTVAASRPSV